jgi:hypothetical protein
MLPTALRWSAVPLGLLAFVLRVAGSLWIEPITWRFSFATSMLIIVGASLVAIGVPFGVFALLNLGNHRRPAAFASDDGAFTVPPSPVWAGSQFLVWMFLSGGLVMTERVPDGDTMRLAQLGFASTTVSVVGVGLFWAVGFAFLLVQRPRLRLDSTGLTIHRFRRTTHLAWDDLLPGGPPPPTKRRQRQLRVYLAGPPVVDRYPPSEDIPIGWLHIDPAFLADRIRHYVEYQEDRAAIGEMLSTASANAA